VNTASFDGGWMIKVKIANPAELNGLMDGAAYDAMLQEG
jgi:glycine cleavage system H lipoate-binding protein